MILYIFHKYNPGSGEKFVGTGATFPCGCNFFRLCFCIDS